MLPWLQVQLQKGKYLTAIKLLVLCCFAKTTHIKQPESNATIDATANAAAAASGASITQASAHAAATKNVHVRGSTRAQTLLKAMWLHCFSSSISIT